MKKQVIITVILLIATAYITVVYFKNLNPPGTRTSHVMHAIPGDASLIFEFNNDKGFYDIFKDNKLFTSVIGNEKLDELNVLKQQLIDNSSLTRYFTGQNIYISIHPSKTNTFNLLLTISSVNGFEPDILEQTAKQPNSGLVITPIREGNKQGYNIYVNRLKKRFYLISKGDHIYSGSFSKEVVDQSAVYKNRNDQQSFVLLSDQQSSNSLANLYVNYRQLTPLFDLLFSNRNNDILKNLKQFPALAALSLNYRSDALMFNGSTHIDPQEKESYLTIFSGQQPVANHLKDIFPSTTAYATNFAVSNPLKFASSLTGWQDGLGLKKEKDQLFNKIKAETGISLKTEFNNLLGNEFAMVTTRYFEKLAIVSVNNGSKLKTLLTAVSNMKDENFGQLNYEKLPLFLLGDAFSPLKKPYFVIIDNYLILATSSTELTSYYDSYINRKFLSKNEQFNKFDELLAGQSNICFFFHFKNALPIFERDMYPDLYNSFKSDKEGWKNFYAASIQFSTADKSFYTNFCLKVNTDTLTAKKLK